MPSSKAKPSEIAAETKKSYNPYIRNNLGQWPSTSYLCDTDSMPAPTSRNGSLHCRFAFFEADPVDFALDWMDPSDSKTIPVIMPANDKRAGGDWEAGVMSPEECLCRRSNLAATLSTPAQGSYSSTNYPIPARSGIYSEHVVVFRDGPDKYEKWQEYKALPIISVCPVKRPKLDSSGKKYSFKAEKELMRAKIRAALRIAVYYGHTRLCIGTFGLGPGFLNPPQEVAMMWRDALLKDPEFENHFQDIVFAFQSPEGPLSTSSSSHKHSSSRSSGKSSSSSGSSSSSSSSSSKSSVTSDLETFRYVFKPSNIHNAFKN